MLKRALITFSLFMGVATIGSACRSGVGNQDLSPETISASTKPNILILIADDLGTDKVGIYQEGDDVSRPKTPHIDALAQSGLRFKNAYAYPVCSPTRTSILTGREAFRTGIGTAVGPRSDFALAAYPEELTLPKLFSLANSGYRTAHFGKWHINIQSRSETEPLGVGFEHSAGYYANLQDYYRFTKQVDNRSEVVTQYATLDTQQDIINYIKSSSGSQPWLVWAAFHAPHSPFHKPPEGMYQTPITDSNNRLQLYTAAVEALDTSIGEVLKAVPENTVVFLLGDNGSPGPVTQSPFDSQRAKDTLYEGGINVPFVVSWPGHTPENKEVTDLVHVMDIFSTAAELAGITPAEYLPANHVIDSHSFAPLLQQLAFTPRQSVRSEQFSPNGLSGFTAQERTVRDLRFKLLENVTEQTEAFYDLSKAPDGLDGENLCPCPESLSGTTLTSYQKLHAELQSMQ